MSTPTVIYTYVCSNISTSIYRIGTDYSYCHDFAGERRRLRPDAVPKLVASNPDQISDRSDRTRRAKNRKRPAVCTATSTSAPEQQSDDFFISHAQPVGAEVEVRSEDTSDVTFDEVPSATVTVSNCNCRCLYSVF